MGSPSTLAATLVGSNTANSLSTEKKEVLPQQDAIINIDDSPILLKDASQGQMSSFKDLFSFTQQAHVPIVVCAFFTAALVAGARTAYAVLTGRIFDLVTRFGAGLLTGSDFLSQMSRWSGYMCLLGLGMWLVASLDVALWVITGELRAKTARKLLFASFLRKTMTWYDSRDHGMSSLMVGIHR